MTVKKRTDADLKHLMHNCFMYMLNANLLKSQDTLFLSLKSLMFTLEQTEGLSREEQIKCLTYFFCDYNKGCTPPMTNSQIKDIVIPAIFSYRKVDMSLSISILSAVL